MSSRKSADLTARACANFVRQHWSAKPILGIILGSGSGQIAESIAVEKDFDYEAIPDFPKSTAMGHRGRLVCGGLNGRPVIALQGRFHPYEGHAFDRVTLPMHLFSALGIDSAFITNAAGGLNPRYRVGDLMAIRSHLDLMNLTAPNFGAISVQSSSTNSTRPVPRVAHRVDKACRPNWIELAEKAGRRNDFVVHRGVYAGVLGPNYETRAEIRMLRRLGADAVGMSTIGEIATAAMLDINVLAVSVITNVANPDQPDATSGEGVVDAAQPAEPRLLALVNELIGSLA